MSFMLGIIGSLPSFIRTKIIPDMLIPEITNDASKVQLCRLSHVYFEHPDLNEFSKFAKDFGFIEAKRTKDKIYFRGYGKDQYVYVATKNKDKKPRFMGACFVALNREEFDKAAKIEGAEMKSLTDAPGGGEMITIPRLGDTYMHIIYGQKEREVDPQDSTASTHDFLGPLNTPFEKPRRGKIHPFSPVLHTLSHGFQDNSNVFTKDPPWSTSWVTSATFAWTSTKNLTSTPRTSTSSPPTYYSTRNSNRLMSSSSCTWTSEKPSLITTLCFCNVLLLRIRKPTYTIPLTKSLISTPSSSATSGLLRKDGRVFGVLDAIS